MIDYRVTLMEQPDESERAAIHSVLDAFSIPARAVAFRNESRPGRSGTEYCTIRVNHEDMAGQLKTRLAAATGLRWDVDRL